MTARRSFVIARSIGTLLCAVAAAFTPGLDRPIIVGGIVITALLQPIVVRFSPSDRMIERQTLIDLQLALLMLWFAPAFLPLATLWIGAAMTWFIIVSTRAASVRVGLVIATGFAMLGVMRPIDNWPILTASIALSAVLHIMLAASLRGEMWDAESALVDALSAAGAVVHHSNLEDGTVVRIEGDVHAITGWTSDEWCSAPHRSLVHPDDVDQYWIDVDAIAPNTVVDRIARVRHKDGSWVWLRDVARIGIDRDGKRSLRGFWLDVTEVEVAARTVAIQARIDTLTRLPNRWALTERVDEMLSNGRAFALLILDLDRFKEVNDTLGHEAGDQLLEVIAQRLTSVVADSELLARLGGDEFAIIVDGAESESDLVDLLRDLNLEASRPLTVSDVQIAVSISSGVALSKNGDGTRATLMRHADIAMYEAKRSSVSHRFFDDTLEQSSMMRLSLSAALPGAITSGALALHFQPKFDIVSRRIVGAEGLARWEHPDFGLLTPAAFLDITLVSESSVAFALSTIRHTTTMIRRLADLGHDLPIAANIALGALRTAGFADSVLAILDEAGVRHDRLVIELTESDIQWPSVVMFDALEQLVDQGVEISIDDFGTGHSSLERIRTLRVDELKIDRSFVGGMIDNPVDRQLVRTVIDLATSLDFRLVAEGVETEREAAELVAMGCDTGQGYLFAMPIPPCEFVALVESNAADTTSPRSVTATR